MTVGPMPIPDSAGDMVAHVVCFDCAYDLRGQLSVGRCPECGLSVAESIERYRRLTFEADPRRVRRVAWLALGAVGAFVALLVAELILLAINFDGGIAEWLGYIMLGFALVGSFAIAALVTLSARSATRETSANGWFNRRILGVVGWAFPTLLLAVWALVFVESFLAHISVPFVAIEALSMSLWLAAGLFPLALTAELRRSVVFWPHGRALSVALHITWFALAIGFWVNTLALLAGLIGRAFVSYSPDYNWQRPYYFDVVEYAGMGGSLIYALGMIAFVGVLIAVIIGARRRRRDGRFGLAPYDSSFGATAATV